MDAKLQLRYFWYHLREQTFSSKNQRNCWENNLKCLEGKAFRSWRKTSIRMPSWSSETHKHWGTETAQYRLKIILKHFIILLQMVLLRLYSIAFILTIIAADS